MLNLVDLRAGRHGPLHSHPHEQLGIVLKGMQALVIDGVAHELHELDGYVLPAASSTTLLRPGGCDGARRLLPGARGLPRALGDVTHEPVRRASRSRGDHAGDVALDACHGRVVVSGRRRRPARCVADLVSSATAPASARAIRATARARAGSAAIGDRAGSSRAVHRPGEVRFSRRFSSAGSMSSRSPVGGQPDDHARAAAARAAQRERGRVGVADRVERVVAAVAREPRAAPPSRRRAPRRASRPSRSACARRARARIDDDDRLGARDARALHHELADAARADDEHRRAGSTRAAKQHRADAGERRAAEQRGLLERDRRRRSAARPLVDDDAARASAPVAVPR